jgi:hypothetical protein
MQGFVILIPIRVDGGLSPSALRANEMARLRDVEKNSVVWQAERINLHAALVVAILCATLDAKAGHAEPFAIGDGRKRACESAVRHQQSCPSLITAKASLIANVFRRKG